MYVSSTRCWISCVLCKHITNDIIMPDGCQYVHWLCARNAPFHLLDGGETSLQIETKGQLCNEGSLKCGGRCRVRIAGSYRLKCRICKLRSFTLCESKTVQPTLHVISANGSSSLRVSCPLGKCGKGSLCPHAVQVALATNLWGAVQAHLASNGVLADDQAHNRGGQTFPKSTEFRNSIAFRVVFSSLFLCFSVRGCRFGFRVAFAAPMTY